MDYSVSPSLPTAVEIRAARKAAGLTQTAAAAMLYRSDRNWRQWELGERKMDPALWRLWLSLASAGR